MSPVWHTWTDCAGRPHRWWGVVHRGARSVACGGKPALLAAALAGASAAGAGVGVWNTFPEPVRRAPVDLDSAILWADGRPLTADTESRGWSEGTGPWMVPGSLTAVGGSPTLIPALGITAFAQAPYSPPDRTDVPCPPSLWVLGGAVVMVVAGRRWAR